MKRTLSAVAAGLAAATLLTSGVACDRLFPAPTKAGSPAPNSPGGSQHQETIQVLNDAAAVLETVKDKASLDAARPQLQSVGGRLASVKPVLATAGFLAKEAPGVPREGREQLAAQVKSDPKFQPYLAAGTALANDPQFITAYRRYNAALGQAMRVPGAMNTIQEDFQISF